MTRKEAQTEGRGRAAVQALRAYVEKQGYQGYDCYDALNSPVIRGLCLGSKWLRISWIQLLKRMPVNLRPVLGVRKGLNPKGLGLLLGAYARFYRHSSGESDLKSIALLAKLLFSLRSDRYSAYCWGYNFDWQSRVFFVPKFTPTIVNTAFIGHGFIDAFEVCQIQQYLDVARSCCDFILNDLHRTEEDDMICFSYTPMDTLKVHNANILGAGLLARVASHTGEPHLLEEARRSVGYVMRYQHDDGSWHYAETGIQHWIDSFHTGFVLDSLNYYLQSSQDTSFASHFDKGLDYYTDHFFLEDGTPKYYPDRTYPIDIHSAAEAIVVLSKFVDRHNSCATILDRVVRWTLDHMQDREGYFYFQKHAHYTNKIAYMRWSQCWMIYALSHYNGPLALSTEPTATEGSS